VLQPSAFAFFEPVLFDDFAFHVAGGTVRHDGTWIPALILAGVLGDPANQIEAGIVLGEDLYRAPDVVVVWLW
jgi:hypothetical protein